MAHKLLIEAKVRTHKRFSKYLKDYEVIRGETFTITFTIRNIADKEFVGGVVKSLSVAFGIGESGVRQIPSFQYKIPAIAPDDEYELAHGFMVPATGGGWVNLEIEANDKEPIEYYQVQSQEPLQDKWVYPLYSVDRETVEILSLLKRLVKRGEKNATD